MNESTTELLKEAIKFYDFKNPNINFIRHNENITYSIEDGHKRYLLRIHKEAEGLDFSFFNDGFSRELLVSSEIDLLNSLSVNNNLITQRPVRNKGGQYLSRTDCGIMVTVLSWIDGDTLYERELSEPLVYRIGQMTALLHQSTHTLPSINRCVYDITVADKYSTEIQLAERLGHIDGCTYDKFFTLINRIKKYWQSKKRNLSLFMRI